MQAFLPKLVTFLERYCQWLVVAIAAAFFLFALYQYLPGISQPVAVQIGDQTLPAGEVDRYIADNAVGPINASLTSTARIDLPVPNYVTRYNESARRASTQPALNTVALFTHRNRYPEEIVPREGDDLRLLNQGGAKVAALPTLPAAIIDPAPTSGFAQVETKPENRDETWVRVQYTISTQLLKQAFNSVNIPANQSSTAVVRVELIRQRQLPGDKWGEPEVLPAFVPPNETLRTPPPANSPTDTFREFRGWAETHQPLILQPGYYTVLKGDDPRVAKPVEAVAVEVFDPATFPRTGNTDKLTAEQRKAVLDYRKAHPITQQPAQGGAPGMPPGGVGAPPPQPGQPRNAGRRQSTPSRSSGGRSSRGAPQEALPEAPTPGAALFQMAPPPGYPGVSAASYPPGYPGAPGSPYPPGYPGSPYPTQAGSTALPPVPQAAWDPNTLTGDLVGVCYDTTAIGDATYRYRVRYSIANPIFGAQNVAVNPNLTKQFEIVGEDATRWSDPVEIAPRTHIFLQVQPSVGATSARFTIYTWQGGRQHKAIQTAVSGDAIGHPEGGIDYSSPWTFVEVRKDPSTGGVYALLMSSEGRLRRQVASVDQASPIQKRLQNEVDVAEGKAVAPAANVPPGMPPGAPGMPPGAGVVSPPVLGPNGQP